MKPVEYLRFGLGVLFVFVSTSMPVWSQGGARPTQVRPDPIQLELNRRLESEAVGRKLAGHPRRNPEQRAGLAQVKEDFLRIQVVNNDLRALASRTDLDLKLVTKSASEITKRAKRLRDNLALPEGERDREVPSEKAGTEIEQLRLALSVLSDSIDAFVQNPVFEKSGLVDAKLSAQARGDLERIIVASTQAKTGSEQIERATRKATGP